MILNLVFSKQNQIEDGRNQNRLSANTNLKEEKL